MKKSYDLYAEYTDSDVKRLKDVEDDQYGKSGIVRMKGNIILAIPLLYCAAIRKI